jgi:hypothetical protein
MGRQLGEDQGVGLGSHLLAAFAIGESRPLAGMQRDPPAQVREREGADAVPAVRRADQLEERGVLGDPEQLTVAHGPAHGRETAREDADLADEWLWHEGASGTGTRGRALQKV